MKKTIYAILVLCLLLALSACEKPCEHTYTETITAEASCSQVGTKTFTCAQCGDSYTEEIPMLEHTFGNAFVTKEATCTETGEKSARCIDCRTEIVVEKIDSAKHKYTSKVITEATCTAEGEKMNTCSVCNDSYTETIQKTSHSYTAKVTTAATCTATGVKTYTCSACGHSKTETISKTAHSYTSKVTTAATCTDSGVKTFTCKGCGHSTTEKISAKGHNYSSKTTAAATCTASGTKKFTCSDCGKSYTETIAAKGHKWVNATCTKAKHCSNCGATSGSALGHSYGSDGKCTRCGAAPSVTIILPDIPKTFSYYGYSGKYTSCEVTKISTSLDYVSSKGLDYDLTVEGTCSYNKDGNNQSTSMKIGYKLYDADGIVVKSGTIYTEAVAVGEKFRETISLYDLIPGDTYTLVLLDVN